LFLVGYNRLSNHTLNRCQMKFLGVAHAPLIAT